MQVNVRPYQIEDCPSILEIVNYNINHTTNIYEYLPRTLEEQIQQFEDKLKKDFPILIAEINNELVGFGYYSEFRTRPAYQFTIEHSVYVSNQHQHKGIGKILLTELIQLAQKQDKKTIIAVIDSENQNSVVFHQKAGFRTVGIIEQSGYKFDRWLHTVIMQLTLKP